MKHQRPAPWLQLQLHPKGSMVLRFEALPLCHFEVHSTNARTCVCVCVGVGGGGLGVGAGRAGLPNSEGRLLAFWLRRLGVAVLINYGVTAAAAAGLCKRSRVDKPIENWREDRRRRG
jgi:hypothetical protein